MKHRITFEVLIENDFNATDETISAVDDLFLLPKRFGSQDIQCTLSIDPEEDQ